MSHPSLTSHHAKQQSCNNEPLIFGQAANWTAQVTTFRNNLAHTRKASTLTHMYIFLVRKAFPPRGPNLQCHVAECDRATSCRGRGSSECLEASASFIYCGVSCGRAMGGAADEVYKGEMTVEEAWRFFFLMSLTFFFCLGFEECRSGLIHVFFLLFLYLYIFYQLFFVNLLSFIE